MLLTLLVLTLLLFVTLFLATQGALSAVLQLITAVFASLLALGVYESLAPFLANTRAADYAYGVAFLGVFFLAFMVLRTAADLLVPRNVVLPTTLDRAVGGSIGFLAAIVLVGTTLVGVEMLPVEERMLSFSSEPTAVFPETRPWPARVVTTLYDLTSGRGLMGTRLQSVHPDLGTELTGYRHTVAAGARQTLSPDLVSAKDVYELDEKARAGIIKDLAAAQAKDEEHRQELERKLGEPGQRFLVVRTAISLGAAPPAVSCDPTTSGDTLLLTPPQVRLVAALADFGAVRTAPDKDRTGLLAEAVEFRQYYPVGVLRGSLLEPLHLAKGFLAQKYATAATPIYHDWVFLVDDRAVPTILEIKRGGRVPLEALLRTKPPAPLTEDQMGQDAVAQQRATLRIQVNLKNSPLENAEILVIPQMVQNRHVSTLTDSVWRTLEDNADKCDNNKGGWTKTPANANVPGSDDFLMASRALRELGGNTGPEALVDWFKIIPPVLLSSLSSTPSANFDAPERCFNDQIRPKLTILAQKRTDRTGNAPDIVLPAADYTVIVKYKSPTLFVLALPKATLTAQKTLDLKVNLSTGSDTAFHVPLR